MLATTLLMDQTIWLLNDTIFSNYIDISVTYYTKNVSRIRQPFFDQ